MIQLTCELTIRELTVTPSFVRCAVRDLTSFTVYFYIFELIIIKLSLKVTHFVSVIIKNLRYV